MFCFFFFFFSLTQAHASTFCSDKIPTPSILHDYLICAHKHTCSHNVLITASRTLSISDSSFMHTKLHVSKLCSHNNSRPLSVWISHNKHIHKHLSPHLKATIHLDMLLPHTWQPRLLCNMKLKLLRISNTASFSEASAK
uniref:Putative secreted protein n=1 Tax=Rhipicephalus microplus TaxID=6941 RepID=A0A6M2DC82_RHIMP